MPLRVVISADEFGAAPGGFDADPDMYPVFDKEGVSVPFGKIDNFITELRRVADELEAKKVAGAW